MKPEVKILALDTIELHYWLNDGTHTMDAHVFNRCEHEFLGIVSEIATKLKIQVDIEVEPIGEGGIRAWFKFAKKNEKAIKIAFLTYLITQVLLTPLTTTLDYTTKRALEYIFEDRELKELLEEKEKEELKQEIIKIKAETKRLCDSIDENKIKKKRSNYYEEASKCNKIEKISVSATDDEKATDYGAQDVLATEFKHYIMTSDDLEPEYDDNATIEIISPVLKKGKYQWLGIYNGAVIQFKMKSNEFKTLVQTGQIPFKNGSSIICQLVIGKRIDNQGDVKITGYEVTEVYKFFENDTPIETPEGRRKRQQQEAEKSQMSLFGDEDFN